MRAPAIVIDLSFPRYQSASQKAFVLIQQLQNLSEMAKSLPPWPAEESRDPDARADLIRRAEKTLLHAGLADIVDNMRLLRTRFFSPDASDNSGSNAEAA